MVKARRNDPCPCGSGKKYKFCCYQKNYLEVKPGKIKIPFTLDNGTKILEIITSMDSIPTHNKHGISPTITSAQMMDLCLDEMEKKLKLQRVGMLSDLVDQVIKEMDIIPTFSYRGIGERMAKDGRFEIYKLQICCLSGENPVELMADKLDI